MKEYARFFSGADIGSDHDRVLTRTTSELKLNIKCITKSLRIRSDLKKLIDPKTKEVFQANMGVKFAALCVLDSDVGPPCGQSERSAILNS